MNVAPEEEIPPRNFDRDSNQVDEARLGIEPREADCLAQRCDAFADGAASFCSRGPEGFMPSRGRTAALFRARRVREATTERGSTALRVVHPDAA